MKIKESQRKTLWKADKLFTAAAALSMLVENDQSYAPTIKGLETRAHELVKAAGFEDRPTFQLSAWCAKVCADYMAGKLIVIPFE